jgi:hypothetical protein
MTKRILFMTMVLAGICTAGHATDNLSIFARYQEIVQGETNAPAAMKKARQYLTSLSRDDFMTFIRQAGKQAEFARENADAGFVMAIFSKCYTQGSGKDEPTLVTLKQLSDPTLPNSWKMGLLDILRLDDRGDLTEAEVATVIATLNEVGQDKQNSDVFRSFCLGRLGGLLYSQQELIAQKAPDLKNALEKQDRAALPKRDDANVRQAAKLIDAILDYRTAIQKTADEVKDEKIKVSLKRRLANWQPNTGTPTK